MSFSARNPFLNKFLLVGTFVFILFAARPVQGQVFTPGNLTVLRLGDGSTALTSAAAQVSVVEYTTSGVPTGVSIVFPSSGTTKITNSGSATSEGMMGLSAERDLLIVSGYDAPLGTAAIASSAAATYNRELFGVTSASGYSKVAFSTTAYSGNNIRSGTSSGTNYFSAGPSNGIELLNTSTQLTSAVVNMRVVQIFNGQTYFSSASGAYLGVSMLGTGLPTTSGTPATFVTSPTSGSAYGFSISPNGNTLYIADDATGIKKYTLSGSVFNLNYVVNSINARGLTVDYSGTQPVLYATTTATSANTIIKITDAGAGSAYTTIATAPANYVFRGIAFSPACYATIAITGPTNFCSGDSTTLIIKGNPTGTVTYNKNGGSPITATIGNNGQVAISSGPLTTTTTFNLVSITTPSCSSVPLTGSVTVTVNPTVAPIAGTPTVCVGFTTALSDTGSGTWTSSTPAIATIGSGTGIVTGMAPGTTTITFSPVSGCPVSTVVTVNALPSPISGPTDVCVGSNITLTDPGGGTWISSNVSVATVGSTTGVVAGVAVGSVFITYTLGTGCYTTSAVTVNNVPTAITGPVAVCVGSTIALTDTTTGGTWTSSNSGIASVGSVTGIVTGVSSGIVTVTYMLTATGCFTTYTVTVNPLPLGIAGTPIVCVGSTTTLIASGGGVWTSSNTLVATVGSSTGIVAGVSSGTSVITYTLGTGCLTSTMVTVNPLPSAITGPSAVCVGVTITLSCPGGGVWTSSSTSIASVGSSSGVVAGVVAGIDTIQYTLATGCGTYKIITVNPAPAVFVVIGGGSYCAGDTGVHILLSGSVTGVQYQMYNGGTAIGVPHTGTGLLLDFGLFTTAGSYTVIATNVFGCTAPMTGTAVVSVNSLPPLFTVTGGGSYCSGGAGFHVGLSGSSIGISYQLLIGATPIGLPLSGTGSSIDFGLQTAAGTYTILATNSTTGCSRLMTGSAVIIVNPLPGPIAGPSSVCIGATINLTDAGGGSWISSTPAVAAIGASSGIVTGVTTGTTNITYTLPVTGCFITKVVTVSVSPVAISGPSRVCTGATVTLTDLIPGGLWTSGTPGVASIGSLSGVVSGITPGTSLITYSLGTGCTVTRTITVYPSPAAIAGTTNLCAGTSVTLSDPTTGGVWSSSNSTVATIGSATGVVNGLIAGTSIISYTVANGCAATAAVSVTAIPTPILGTLSVCIGAVTILTDAAAGGTWVSGNTTTATIGSTSGIVNGVSAGTSIITYSVGPGCTVTAVVTVNPLPLPITGTPFLCIGRTTILSDATPGGTWSTANPTIATVGSTSGLVNGIAAGVDTIFYSLTTTGCTTGIAVTVNSIPPAISGAGNICLGQSLPLSNAVTGGTWTSSNTSIVTVGSTTGIATGIALGVATISYLTGGCIVTATVTVVATPAPIAGLPSVCVGNIITLSCTSPGGTWSSSNYLLASIGSVTGVVYGQASGTVIISYTLGTTGCSAVAPIIVNPLPPIIGSSALCVGQSTVLIDSALGGSWSSSNTGIATVTSGLVTGIAAGTVTISYSLPTGCVATKVMTINPLPLPIGGPDHVCVAQTITLTDAVTGGTWGSSNPSIATVSPAMGLVTGVSAGTATISYVLTTGCFITKGITVNPLPSPIVGPANVCVGSSILLADTDTSGVWGTSLPAVATVMPTGVITGISPGVTTISYTISTGCTYNKIITVDPNPSVITGASDVCVGYATTFTDSMPGGNWFSSNYAVADVNLSTGVVSGISAGTAIITYILGTGCFNTKPVTVFPIPPAITGNMELCVGANDTLQNLITGGIWSSSNTSVASIGSGSGVVFGVSAGIVVITYTLGSGCYAAASITVNPLPTPIFGTNFVCTGITTILFNGTSGGSWISSNPSVATINSSGIVTGASAGTSVITYVLSSTTGCATTTNVTVNPFPSAITGSDNICLAATAVMHDSVSGGSWVSTNTSVATIGSTTGIVAGVTVGTCTIVYQFPGCAVSKIINVQPLPAVFTVTGGGNRCPSDSGVHIGLSGSTVGVNYMLFNGPTAVGAFPGSGSVLDFGLQTVGGTYTVVGTSTATTCHSNMAGAAFIGLITPVIPAVSVNLTPNDTVCAGTTVTFNSVPVNGGSAPAYQWRVNGFPVAFTGSYSFIPANGDVVSVTMTSNASCPIPATVTRSVTMTVQPFGTPNIAVVLSPNDTVCQGTLVTANAVTAFAGNTPVYTWVKNGTVVSYSGLSYSFVPNNGDEVYGILNSNYPCRLLNIDSSAKLKVATADPILPVVTLSAVPGFVISKGKSDTLTAYVANAVAPTYQWYINGFPAAGATNGVFIHSAYSHPQQDSVSCAVTSHAVCEVTTHQWMYIKVVTVGLHEVGSAFDRVVLVPNPNSGVFVVRGTLNCTPGENFTLEVTDIIGKVIYNRNFIVHNNLLDEFIDLGNTASGMYLLKVYSGSGGKIFHFVVNGYK